ncbi:MAG: S41 family peptidase [bacterium]|nr:S41 family peptidase [bacterium]
MLRETALTLLLAPLAASAGAADLDRKARRGVVDELAKSLREVYVFAEQAEEMATRVENRLKDDAYSSTSAPDRLAALLTSDLRGVAADKHLRVFVLPPEARQNEDDLKEARRRYEARAWRENYGFRQVRILDGNVGYLELKKFADPTVAGDAAAAAMAMLGNSEALIIDLRENFGGSPFMAQILISYLLEDAPQHLVDQYVRSLDATRQIYSLPWVPGKRMPDIPVYVLISSQTFSAAEGFTYMLQSMERASVVGERSAGGAHPVKVVNLGHGLAAAIPFARAINPITESNWEGTGIAPDIEAPAAEALDVAYAEALKALAESADDDARRAELEKIFREHGLR